MLLAQGGHPTTESTANRMWFYALERCRHGIAQLFFKKCGMGQRRKRLLAFWESEGIARLQQRFHILLI